VQMQNRQLGRHQPIKWVEYTGTLTTQEYCVDDIPNFAGITVEAVYDVEGSTSIPPQEIHKQIPNSILVYYDWMLDYRTDFANPRLEISIPIAGGGFSVQRIPVRAIYQIAKLEIENPPAFADPIFIDDPRYVASGAPGSTSMVFTERYWRGEFADTRIKVSYIGTDRTKSVTVAQLLSMNVYQGQLHGTSPMNGFGMLLPGDTTLVSGTPMVPAADQWSARTPKITFFYYGIPVKQEIPVYNRLDSILVTPRVGDLLVMNGYGELNIGGTTVAGGGPYKPDDIVTFMSKIKVSATYSMTADRSRTAVREDVQADINQGKLLAPSFTGAESARNFGLHIPDVVGPASGGFNRFGGSSPHLLIPANDGDNNLNYYEAYYEYSAGDPIRNPTTADFATWTGGSATNAGNNTNGSILSRENSDLYRNRVPPRLQRVTVGFGSIGAYVNHLDSGGGEGSVDPTTVTGGLGVRTANAE